MPVFLSGRYGPVNSPSFGGFTPPLSTFGTCGTGRNAGPGPRVHGHSAHIIFARRSRSASRSRSSSVIVVAAASSPVVVVVASSARVAPPFACTVFCHTHGSIFPSSPVTGGGSGMGCHGAGSAIARGASATRASISRRDLLPSFEPAESALPAVVLHDWSALRAPI
eukprot:26343-Pelagococcus_subviridis.AAC.15